MDYNNKYYELSGIKVSGLTEKDFEYFSKFAANQKTYQQLTGEKLTMYDIITDIEIGYLTGSKSYEQYFQDVFMGISE